LHVAPELRIALISNLPCAADEDAKPPRDRPQARNVGPPAFVEGQSFLNLRLTGMAVGTFFGGGPSLLQKSPSRSQPLLTAQAEKAPSFF
jgi:hypothetical protein